jgi:hypothetical protein
VLPIIFADTSATIVVEDRTEQRVRATPDGVPSFDLATMPRARFNVRDRIWDSQIYYWPLLTLRNIENVGTPSDQGGMGLDVLHQGGLYLSWRSRRMRISLGEDASYGDYNFTYLLPLAQPQGAPPRPVQALPSLNRTMLFASTRTSLTGFFILDRHHFLTVQPSFWAGGGGNEASREQLPFQRTPRIDVMFDTIVSRRDMVSTIFAAQAADFSVR